MNSTVLCLLILATVCALGAKVPQLTPVFPEDLETHLYSSDGRIINGIAADRGQFPWQVSIYLYLPSGRHFCGGSLISNRWVLTAAHCAQNVIRFEISLGGLTTSSQEQGRVTIDTNKAIVHENYDSSSLNNDIALIDLDVNVPTSDHIKPIRLPLRGEVVGDNQELEVSGWGKTSDQASTVSPILNYVHLRSIANYQCQATYGSNIIVSSTLCALGNTIESTCNGDSGGGLVVRDYNGEATHVGVVSFVSSAGCAAGYPSGYVRTESYLDWISRNTGIEL